MLLEESPALGPAPPDLGSAVRSEDEEGDEAPLEADGLPALELDGEFALELPELDGELEAPALAPLDEPLDAPADAEPEDPPTPRAASVCWSSLPVDWIPFDCWNSFTAAWVFGPSLPSAGPESMPAVLSFS